MRVFAAAVLVLALAAPSAGAQSRRASLQLVSASPEVAVRGSGFGAREQVALTLRLASSSRVVVVRASPRGVLQARFGGVRVGRCENFAVEAAGRRGSRALLQVAPGCRNAKGPPERALPRPPK